jgi:hypothetical protein
LKYSLLVGDHHLFFSSMWDCSILSFKAMNRITSNQLTKQQRALDAQRTTLENDPAAVLPPVPDVVYPVVIIEGFLTKENARQHFIYEMLAEWAALLAEYHIAQVVFVSNNPAATKYIGRGTCESV